MIIQTFFVSAVSGSLISQITAMVENPTMIVSLVSQSVIVYYFYFVMGCHSRILRKPRFLPPLFPDRQVHLLPPTPSY